MDCSHCIIGCYKLKDTEWEDNPYSLSCQKWKDTEKIDIGIHMQINHKFSS